MEALALPNRATITGTNPGTLHIKQQDDLVRWAELQRLTPKLELLNKKHRFLESEATSRLEANLINSELWRRRLELVLCRIAETLGQAKIDFILIKGLAAAHTIHESPSHRQTGDLDLLVRHEDFTVAADLIEHRLGAEPQLKGIRRLGRTTVPESGRTFKVLGAEIDLHHSVETKAGSLGVRTATYFDPGLSLDATVSGIKVKVPVPELLLLHAFCHLAASHTRLSTLDDILQISRSANIDHELIKKLTRDEGIEGLAAWAVDASESALVTSLGLDLAIRRSHPKLLWTRFLLSRRELAFGIWLLRREGVANAPHLLLDMIWPGSDYLDHTATTRGSSLKDVGRRLMRTFSSSDAPITTVSDDR